MIPLSYGYRNLLVRWKTTLMTAGGFTLVMAALIVMLAFVEGIKTVCDDSGQPTNVVVLSKGNTDEVFSRIDVQTARQVENARGVARGSDARRLVSRELFLVITQPDQTSGDYQMLQTRGVMAETFRVHTRVKLVEGRRFRRGRDEFVIGRRLQHELGLKLGDRKQIGRKMWTVVGVFEAGGSMFESEIWCDLQDLAGHFRRKGMYTSLVARAQTPAAAQQMARLLTNSRLINVDAQTEPAHYAKQAEQTEIIHTAGIVIAVFMGIGAVFGVINTMFAAISQRIKDIAVMRLLGFQRREIMISFLIEALLITVIGDVLGTALGYSANGVSLTFSTGAKSIAFAFIVSGKTIALATAFTLAMGLLGGLLPAWTAMHVKPLESLRA